MYISTYTVYSVYIDLVHLNKYIYNIYNLIRVEQIGIKIYNI